MSRSWIILIAALGGVTGCTFEEVDTSSTPRPDPASPASSDLPSDPEPIDPFYLAIEAERWTVMIENARGIQASQMDYIEEGDGRLRVHRALLTGIHTLMSLRNEACLAGKVTPETCDQLRIPDWAFIYERDIPSLETLQERSDWLGEALQPFVSAMCQTEDDGWLQACAVE